MAKSSGGSGGGIGRGSFITDGMVRGLVTGRGYVGSGRNKTPVYRVNIGGGRTSVIPVAGARNLYRGS
jgi:hypothetical protein